MPDRQLLHLVIGGELEDLSTNRFKDLSKVDLVGAFPNYAEAVRAWRAVEALTARPARSAAASS